MPTPCPPGHVPDYMFRALVGLCFEEHWTRAKALLQLMSQWYPPTNDEEKAQYADVVLLIDEGCRRSMTKTAN